MKFSNRIGTNRSRWARLITLDVRHGQGATEIVGCLSRQRDAPESEEEGRDDGQFHNGFGMVHSGRKSGNLIRRDACTVLRGEVSPES